MGNICANAGWVHGLDLGWTDTAASSQLDRALSWMGIPSVCDDLSDDGYFRLLLGSLSKAREPCCSYHQYVEVRIEHIAAPNRAC